MWHQGLQDTNRHKAWYLVMPVCNVPLQFEPHHQSLSLSLSFKEGRHQSLIQLKSYKCTSSFFCNMKGMKTMDASKR